MATLWQKVGLAASAVSLVPAVTFQRLTRTENPFPPNWDWQTEYVVELLRQIMGSSMKSAGSTREQVPTTVEEIRKQFWAEKVDIWKNEATGRGPVDGVWFAENGVDVKGNDRSKTIVFLFLHGGAYQVGDAVQFWRVYIELIKRVNPLIAKSGHRLALFSLEYSLAPEHTYPAALNEAIDAYRWISEELGFKDIIV
ncbi:hypothetical protein HK097_005269, partial [Rhizophlyctis rosea]